MRVADCTIREIVDVMSNSMAYLREVSHSITLTKDAHTYAQPPIGSGHTSSKPCDLCIGRHKHTLNKGIRQILKWWV